MDVLAGAQAGGIDHGLHSSPCSDDTGSRLVALAMQIGPSEGPACIVLVEPGLVGAACTASAGSALGQRARRACSRSAPQLLRSLPELLRDLRPLEIAAERRVYCRYADSIRGADVFILQSGSPPVNDHLVELLVMIDAARLASAHRITAVMPLYPYARQDKKSAPREPVSARLVADLLQTAGADRILAMDLHAGQIQGFFTIPVDHLTALPLFARLYRQRGLHGEEVVSVSPDLGRVKAARRFAMMLKADFAIVTKVRPAHERAIVAEVIGDVRDKLALLGDDMVVTGGTLVAATDALLRAGAREVRAFATHALWTPGALEGLGRSQLAEIAVTDTVALDPKALPSNVHVLGVGDVLGDSIRNVFGDRSVSALFAGENELF